MIFKCFYGKNKSDDIDADNFEEAKLICIERFGECLGVARVVKATKPFDITQHEWSDDEVEFFGKDDGCLLFCASDNFKINKPDGIAIAKALGVTAEDLK